MKGEVRFECDGKQYTLLLSINALCEIEGRLGAGINQVAQDMQNPETMRIVMLRTVFWAALAERHVEITEKQAGDIMSMLGMEKTVEHLQKAFMLVFPEADESENPPKPAEDGTGKTSVGTG